MYSDVDELEPEDADKSVFASIKPAPPQPWYGRSAIGSAALAAGGAGLLCVLLMAISTQLFRMYGWVLFGLAPLICGLAAALLYNLKRPESQQKVFAPAMWVVWALALLCTVALLIVSQLEGLICILMAAPIALVASLIGAVLGRVMARILNKKATQPLPVLAALLLLYPGLQAYESGVTGPPPPHEVVTQRVVAAPPARVWAALVQPVRYPARVGLLFRAGVAYPTRTDLRQHPDGSRWLRVAYSGRGVAELPVTGWVPARELTFAIPVTPAPMQELSPYPDIHAPHLHGYFRVQAGTFRLRPLPGGRTLLEARTVYQHSIGPRDYWQVWSDYLLDEMHGRVLTTIQQRAEHD